MRLIYFTFFLYFNLLSFNIFADTIAVINIQSLIDENSSYRDLISDIESNQEKYLKKFEEKENELQLKLKEIENSKLILNENEINLQIQDYNNQLSEFTMQIEEFNMHYQEQLINIRELLLKEIIILLENYATKNSVDLILDSTSYLIASNSLDITNYISDELEKLNIELKYKDFEKN